MLAVAVVGPQDRDRPGRIAAHLLIYENAAAAFERIEAKSGRGARPPPREVRCDANDWPIAISTLFSSRLTT